MADSIPFPIHTARRNTMNRAAYNIRPTIRVHVTEDEIYKADADYLAMVWDDVEKGWDRDCSKPWTLDDDRESDSDDDYP